MLVYWLLLAGSVLIGYPLCRLKYGKEIYCTVMGIALYIVMAIRQTVGHDYNSYGQMYIDFHSLEVEDIATMKVEKGFGLFLKMLTNLFIDYQVLFYVTAFFIVGAVMLYIYRKSDRPYLSVFCFLALGMYFVSMDFLRQIMAALIMLYALRYIEKKQFLRFIVFTLFAFTFHVSALIMIPFYFILRIKMNYISLGAYAVFTVLFMVFSWQILDFITDYVYKSYNPETSKEVMVGTNPIYMFFFAFFFIIAFIFRKPLTEKSADNNMLLGCMFFTFFFELLGVKHAILSRFSVLFAFPATLILVPRLIDVITEKCDTFFGQREAARNASKVVVIVLFLGICTTMYGLMIAFNYNGVMPYRTIFS